MDLIKIHYNVKDKCKCKITKTNSTHDKMNATRQKHDKPQMRQSNCKSCKNKHNKKDKKCEVMLLRKVT